MRDTANSLFNTVFADNVRKKVEHLILILAGFGFIIHLLLIFLKELSLIPVTDLNQGLLNDPISAIYTPFSLILVYEVYLLLFYLPRSFTSCISKQFEIISLIVIREIFKDIPLMDLNDNLIFSEHNIELIVDLLGFLLLFFLIYLFNEGTQKLSKKNITDPSLIRFISSKKIVSLSLLVVMAFMAINSISIWISNIYSNQTITQIDDLFFNKFFTLLILADVIILLISFRYTEEYSKLIRNTGFIISTILIRLSFSSSGYLTMILILTGISFAYLILKIYNAIENSKTNLKV
ncbi:MAG: hypothetical protein CBD60_02805 [Flavobacteriaceae bacterium TMED200]|nr:MAG: hypothetical protein CBD60_02805 [Flavobacteriaceae bacterium TMED200]|tara:strand:- start:6387 stop:7265 length:879 start_codon:yes stop_codon:yes gene_type:complete